MRMMYAPPGLLGIKPEPVAVEVLERGKHVSRIRKPVPKNCIVNIVREQVGNEPITEVEQEVPNDWLKPIQ